MLKLKFTLFSLVASAIATVLLFLGLHKSAPARAESAATTVTVSVLPPEPPPTAVADSVPVSGDVPKPDTLHQYAVDAILTLTPPYAETVPGVHFESKEMRQARWTKFALACADAVEASDLPASDHPKWVLALLWIAHRETILAKDPCHIHIGTCDDGLAGESPWQIHEYKGLDRMLATTALQMLREIPAAWGLPYGKPWLGLVADRGPHGVNRPSVLEYLRAHPYPAELP